MTARPRTVLAFALCVTACHKDSAPSAPHAIVVKAPVPAPEGLLAELSARGPDALWGRLQQGVGGPLARLPQTVSGALVAGASLDLTLAGEIDGAAPAYAVAARSGASLGWVAAAGLRDFDHAHASLLEGKTPHFVGHDADGGLVVLTASAAPSTEPRFVMALSPLGYLVFASSVADLPVLAPYATRTLPARPRSPHAIVAAFTHEAIAGVVHDRVAASVTKLRAVATQLDASLRADHGGKAPDLGDPTAVIEALDDLARAKLDVLADVSRADLTLDAGEDDLDLELTVTPGAGASAKAFAAIATGDAAPLMTLPADTVAALLVRDDSTTLHDAAAAIESRATAVFKPALTAKDVKAIHGALGAWADTRGPWLTLGLELEGSPALTLRTPTTDAERATHAVSAFVELASVPVFKSMLEARFSVSGTSTATVTVPGAGATSIATFRRADAHGGSEVALAWAVTGELLRMAAASSSARALRASRDPESLLGLDVPLAGKLGALRDRVTFVFAGRRLPAHGALEKEASVVLGLGRDRANGWAMLEIDDDLAREGLARWLDP